MDIKHQDIEAKLRSVIEEVLKDLLGSKELETGGYSRSLSPNNWARARTILPTVSEAEPSKRRNSWPVAKGHLKATRPPPPIMTASQRHDAGPTASVRPAVSADTTGRSAATLGRGSPHCDNATVPTSAPSDGVEPERPFGCGRFDHEYNLRASGVQELAGIPARRPSESSNSTDRKLSGDMGPNGGNLLMFSMLVKLFGVQRGATVPDLEGQSHPPRHHRWLLHPYSPKRVAWECSAAVLVFLSCIEVPFTLAFVPNPPYSLFVLGACIEAMMGLDILLTFNTSFIQDHVVVKNRSAIAIRYLRSWFLIDLISSLPLDAIADMFSSQNSGSWRALEILRVTRLFRLLRLSRLFRYLSNYVDGSMVSHFRVGKLVVTMLFFVHWNGCLQYLIPSMLDFPEGSWVHANSDTALQGRLVSKYSHAIFRALSHMLCIGYGFESPTLISEIWVTMWSMLSGASMYGMLVANMAHWMVSNVDHGSRRFANAIENFNNYMETRAVPRELRERVRQYMLHQYPTRKLFDARSLLHMLPLHLQRDLCRHSCRVLLETVPLLQGADPGFLSAVALVLHQHVVLPGEMLAREGEIMARLVFLETGIVEVISGDSPARHITDLGPGAYLGEISALEATGPGSVASASVRTVTKCKVHVLLKADFDQVLRQFPHVKEALHTVANRRIERYPRLNLLTQLKMRYSENWKRMEALTSHAVEGYLETMQSVESESEKLELEQDKPISMNDATVQRRCRAFTRRHSEIQEESLMPSASIVVSGVMARLRRSGERRVAPGPTHEASQPPDFLHSALASAGTPGLRWSGSCVSSAAQSASTVSQ